jgi:membrane associated rhomboid family serine protease
MFSSQSNYIFILSKIRYSMLNKIKNHTSSLSVLLVPAIICISVFFLPTNIQESLILKGSSITFWSWFTYIFVHQNFSHLFFNLLVYILAILLAYRILPSQEKEKFYIPVIFSIFLVPIITLLLTLFLQSVNLIPIFNNSRGFSGISSMALGMLTFAISKKLQKIWGNNNKMFLLNTCYLILIPSLAILVSNISMKCTLFIFISGFLFILNFLFYVRKNKILLNRVETKELLQIVFCFIILLIGITRLVPSEIVNNGSVTNTVAHLFGYILGFVILFLYYLKK